MDLASGAQILTSVAVLLLALLVDVNYGQRTMINIVTRNIGKGATKDFRFDFSAPVESSGGRGSRAWPTSRRA